MIRKGEDGGDAPAANAAGRSSLSLVAAIVLGAVAGYAVSLPVRPVFVADAQVLIGTGGTVSTGYAALPSSAVESEVAILKSRELAARMIERHDLGRRLDPGRRPDLFDTVLVASGLRSDPSRASIERRALDTLQNGLDVEPVGSSRVIAIRYSGDDPVLAATVANAIADMYVGDQAMVSQRSDHVMLNWLQGEIELLRGRVQEADRRLARHRAEAQLISPSAAGRRSNVGSQQVGELNAELVRARAAHAEAQARADVVRQILKQGSSVEAAREVLDSVLIQRLREQQVKLQSEKAELSSTYLSSHPKIESLQSQLDDLDRQIRREIGKVLKSVQMAAEISGARVASLSESLEQIKPVSTDNYDSGIELRALEQDARAQRELLETFQTRYRTLSGQTGGQRPGARIISRAEPPERATSPVRVLWAATGALAGLLAAILLAVFVRLSERNQAGDTPRNGHEDADVLAAAERRDARLDRFEEMLEQAATQRHGVADANSPAPVDRTVAEDVRVETAEMPRAGPSKASAQPVEPSEQLHQRNKTADPIRQKLQGSEPPAQGLGLVNAASLASVADAPGTAELGRMIAANPARIILFAGADSAQGTDYLAAAAASHAGEAGCLSVLLDIGLRPSALLTPDVQAPGLGQLISGRVPFGGVIRPDEARGTDVIGMGRAIGNPPLKRLTAVVARLARRYDKIILVADRLEDWPDRFVRPDLAVLVCSPELDAQTRRMIYASALRRGARKALIVRHEWPVSQPDIVAA